MKCVFHTESMFPVIYLYPEMSLGAYEIHTLCSASYVVVKGIHMHNNIIIS